MNAKRNLTGSILFICKIPWQSNRSFDCLRAINAVNLPAASSWISIIVILFAYHVSTENEVETETGHSGTCMLSDLDAYHEKLFFHYGFYDSDKLTKRDYKDQILSDYHEIFISESEKQ